MQAFCAAIDWGTTSFRIWLMAEDGSVVSERRSNEGMTIAAETGFQTVLDTHMRALDAPQTLPVVICGMAGSRQGWQEARYLTVPSPLADIAAKAVRVNGPSRDIRILPGLARRETARPDVIRGEETQLLGAFSGSHASGLACMPGTHSKWVKVSNRSVTDFSTYMTGELFSLIARRSILRHAVGDADNCDPESGDFLQAVADAHANPSDLSRLLFSIRGGQLLYGREVTSSFERLSGLLIGSEVGAALSMQETREPIMLIASGKLAALYKSAFLSLGREIVMIDADEAVQRGLYYGARHFWPGTDTQADYG
ncbi:2-dehydro-3-deoxygalactonokinase [Hoeflea poritis]|uniref:2-dehydro-3-deoxygalactonokinase n=1 Tax=Hoeflea poritis TaxID=2993659 RepID=A0ABT4VUG1_9HYPH|nr:2-dehydro-3-deoxygalactonokinase [Hoeflea poritis]MDA4847672.1 2-dehydro-3-deoxygalactonokinase [Hoeflea poritis]